MESPDHSSSESTRSEESDEDTRPSLTRRRGRPRGRSRGRGRGRGQGRGRGLGRSGGRPSSPVQGRGRGRGRASSRGRGRGRGRGGRARGRGSWTSRLISLGLLSNKKRPDHRFGAPKSYKMSTALPKEMPGGLVIAVECCGHEAELYVNELTDRPGTGHWQKQCVKYKDSWLVPSHFHRKCRNTGPRDMRRSWKHAIRHGGKTLHELFHSGVLSSSSTMCRCLSCTQARMEGPIKYLCAICDTEFSSKTSIRAHVKAAHDIASPEHDNDNNISGNSGDAVEDEQEIISIKSELDLSAAKQDQSLPEQDPSLPEQDLSQPEQDPSPKKQTGLSVSSSAIETTSITEFTDDEIYAKLVERKSFFICKCGIIFRDENLYLLHRVMHSPNDPLKCSFCGHQAPDFYDFNSHQYFHNNPQRATTA